jgi:hypothetical protein
LQARRSRNRQLSACAGGHLNLSLGRPPAEKRCFQAKSAVKLVVTDDEPGALYKWVAVLTGSKNALKGVGFFVGALGLSLVGFRTSMLLLGVMILAALIAVVTLMHGELGRPDAKANFGRCSPTTTP